METGFAAAERLLALPERPTAILCSNDMTAIGVLHATSARQLHVPDDVSVVGFDDIHMAQFTVPPLSSVRMACSEVASAALDVLIAAIEGKSPPPAQTLMTKLIVRQSTGYAPSRTNQAASLRPKKAPKKAAAKKTGKKAGPNKTVKKAVGKKASAKAAGKKATAGKKTTGRKATSKRR